MGDERTFKSHYRLPFFKGIAYFRVKCQFHGAIMGMKDRMTMPETDQHYNRLGDALESHNTGILAMPSGGCSRYIFSTNVDYKVDDTGCPVFEYDSGNPFHHHLLSHSSMSLRIEFEKNVDGSDKSWLVLIGLLEAVNDAQADRRTYRLDVERAQLVLETGETRTLDWDRLRKSD